MRRGCSSCSAAAAAAAAPRSIGVHGVHIGWWLGCMVGLPGWWDGARHIFHAGLDA